MSDKKSEKPDLLEHLLAEFRAQPAPPPSEEATVPKSELELFIEFGQTYLSKHPIAGVVLTREGRLVRLADNQMFKGSKIPNSTDRRVQQQLGRIRAAEVFPDPGVLMDGGDPPRTKRVFNVKE